MKISLWPNPAQPLQAVLGLARYAEARERALDTFLRRTAL
jgi:hypothetical protein